MLQLLSGNRKPEAVSTGKRLHRQRSKTAQILLAQHQGKETSVGCCQGAAASARGMVMAADWAGSGSKRGHDLPLFPVTRGGERVRTHHWWMANIQRTIRAYPDLRARKDAMQAQSVTASYSADPRGGGTGRTTELAALRGLAPGEEQARLGRQNKRSLL